MEKITLDIPSMYADHHVLKVRDLLQELDGVEDIYASSAWRQVSLSFDPGKLDRAAIEQTLAEADYPVEGQETPILVERSDIGRDPQWTRFGQRPTRTNPKDREMVRQFHGN